MSTQANGATAPAGTGAAWKREFVLLAAIWGASFLFTRIAAVEIGAIATAGLRVGVAALFLLPLLLARGQGHVLRTHWKPVLVIGTLNSAIPFACFGFALLSISTGLSSILNATTPLFGAVIAWLWLKDQPNGSRILGLGIGFLGVALLAWDKASFSPGASGTSSGWAGPARALSVTFGIPVFAVLYGVVLLGEVVTIWMLGCAIVIVAGTALSSGLVTLGTRDT